VQYFVNLSQKCNCKTNRGQHQFSVLFKHNKILTEHSEYLKKHYGNINIHILKLLHILQQCDILHPMCVTYDLMISIYSTLVSKISMSNQSQKLPNLYSFELGKITYARFFTDDLGHYILVSF